MEVTNINGQIRFCAWEAYNGARRHYLCSQREYCCALGCCVSTAFSLYQLWYFWLLLLLIILLCSGGGWWFRFRHGGFSTHSTPSSGRGRRHGRRHGRGNGGTGPRVYPHQHPFYASGLQHGSYALPPGYDKDPPSYNEVITHLSQFPRIEDVRRTQGEQPSTSAAQAEHLSLSVFDCRLVPPPPTYEMVLDLKRRESQLTREIQELEEEEEREAGRGGDGEETLNSTRGRIKSLLGRIRLRRSSTDTQASRHEGSSPSLPSSASSSSGLFTISRESLPQQDYYAQEAASSATEPPERDLPRLHTAAMPTDTDTSSHSDYSSHFVSSPSSASRSLATTPPQAPMELVSTSPLEGELIGPTPELQEVVGEGEEQQGGEQIGYSRPCTGRSVLSRPTTSISAQALAVPQEITRKTSLPGALLDHEDEGIETR